MLPTSTMSYESLSKVCESRLLDLAFQYHNLIDLGLFQEAEIIAKEGLSLATAHDNDEPFMTLIDLKHLRSFTQAAREL